MKYIDALKIEMEKLAEIPNTIFLGQAVKYPGTALYYTVKDIDKSKSIEMPVAEDMQMGMSIGLALQGFLPISIFPRWNFFICATDQLVNHLDKLKDMSGGEFNPKVIIRVGIGSKYPLFPGHQHIANYTQAYNKMLTNINMVELCNIQDIKYWYGQVNQLEKSIILVEHMDLYNKDFD